MNLSAAEPIEHEGESEALWRQRAIDRSTQAARQRSAKRVQRFLNAARDVITEKNSIEFTVQEVVERSKQSLRSFYLYFDGKHELLFGLFEEEMLLAVQRMRKVANKGDSLDRLRAAVVLLFEISTPTRPDSVQPLFRDFAERLMVDHPEEVAAAYVPLHGFLVDLVQACADAGLLRPGRPRRIANLVMQASTMTANRDLGPRTGKGHALTAEEVWEFCLHAIAPDDVAAAHAHREQRSPNSKS